MKNETFAEQLCKLHGVPGVGFEYSTAFKQATTSINGNQVAVATGDGRFSPAADFWPKAGVPTERASQLVTPESQWRHRPSFEALMDMLKTASVEDFTSYCLGLHAQIEGTVQPTLDAKGKLGFNGHTRFTHQDGMLTRLFMIMENKALCPMEAKIAIFAIIFHDEGCGLGRSAHSLNTIGLLLLMYGEDLFNAPEIMPALGAILKHDEKVIMPVVQKIIQDIESKSDQTEELKVERLMERLAEIGSIETYLLLLLDKSDARRKRALNTKSENLDSEALLEDPHFLANICWDDVKFNVVEVDGKKIFRAQYDFNLAPDDVLATPDNSKLVIIPAHKPPELKMPSKLHAQFKENKKVQSYFEYISELFIKLYRERFELVVLSALQVFPEIDKVEIILHDPSNYETKIIEPGKGVKRQQRQNLDLAFGFSRNKLLSAFRAYEQAAHADLKARKIESILNSVEDGGIVIAEN